MPSISVLGTELTFDNHFKHYSGHCMTAAGSVHVTLFSEADNYDELVQIAERTLRNWSAQLEKVLPEVKKMLVEQRFLPATQVKPLTISDLSVRDFEVSDAGFGPSLNIDLAIEKWRSDPHDSRRASYVESCKNGTAYMDIWCP